MKSSAKKRIERELARVNLEIEVLKKEPRVEELEGFGDNTPLSEEVDAILSAEDRELRSDHLGRLLDRAAALDEALHRVGTGTYGGRPLNHSSHRPESPRSSSASGKSGRIRRTAGIGLALFALAPLPVSLFGALPFVGVDFVMRRPLLFCLLTPSAAKGFGQCFETFL